MFGIIEFGRLLFTYSMISAASREAARYAAAAEGYSDCAGIISAATRIGAFAGVDAGDVTIAYDEGPGTAEYSSVCPPSQYVNLGDRVIVTVSTSFQPVVPIVNVPAIPFSMITRRTIIKDVQMITPTPTT
jgi:Flp pilus assembly protein TadG